MALTKTLEVKIGADTSGFQRGLKRVSAGLTSIKSQALSVAKAGLALAGVTVGLQQLGESFKSYLSLESSVKRVNDLFADSAKYVQYFAQNAQKNFGLAESAAYQYAAVYGNLFKGITGSTEENAKVTIAMLKASSVVASKTGRTMDDVMERIRSGLLGNTEAIEDLGIQVNVAMIETTDAFRRMANGRSWEQLEFYEQQQIRTLAILEQAHKAYGDEVTQGSAYSVNGLSSAFSDLQSTMGMFLNAALQPVIKGLTELVRWANAGLKAVATFLGYDTELRESGVETTDNIADGYDAITDSINSAVKAQKRMIAGFDQVNILNNFESSISANKSSGIASGVFDSLPELELGEKSKELEGFSEALKTIEPFFTGIGNALKEISDGIKDFAGTYLYDWLVNIGAWMQNNPEALEKLGYGLTYLGLGLAVLKGVGFLGEITGIGSLLGKLGKWIFGTKDITDAMKDKNKTLSDQTDLTEAETVAVEALAPAMSSATSAVGSFGTALLGLQLPNILAEPIPAPSFVTPIAPAIDTSIYDASLDAMVDKVGESGIEISAKLDSISVDISESVNATLKNTERNVSVSSEYQKKTLADTLNDINEAAKSKLNQMANNVVSAWNGANNAFHESCEYAANVTRESLNNISQSIVVGLNGAGESIAAWVNGGFSMFKSWAQGIGESALGAMKNLLNVIGSGLQSAWEGIKEFFGALGEKLSNPKVQKGLAIAGVTIAAAGMVTAVVLSGGSALPAISAAAPPVLAALPALADGGILSTPTAALLAEYPGAMSNPEIAAPQSVIHDTVIEANSPMVIAIVSAIQRLEKTLKEKDMDVYLGDDEIARSAARGNRDHIMRTGKALIGG